MNCIIPDEVEKYAQEKGLFVYTQSGDNTIMLNKPGFNARVLGNNKL